MQRQFDEVLSSLDNFNGGSSAFDSSAVQRVLQDGLYDGSQPGSAYSSLNTADDLYYPEPNHIQNTNWEPLTDRPTPTRNLSPPANQVVPIHQSITDTHQIESSRPQQTQAAGSSTPSSKVQPIQTKGAVKKESFLARNKKPILFAAIAIAIVAAVGYFLLRKRKAGKERRSRRATTRTTEGDGDSEDDDETAQDESNPQGNNQPKMITSVPVPQPTKRPSPHPPSAGGAPTANVAPAVSNFGTRPFATVPPAQHSTLAQMGTTANNSDASNINGSNPALPADVKLMNTTPPAQTPQITNETPNPAFLPPVPRPPASVSANNVAPPPMMTPQIPNETYDLPPHLQTHRAQSLQRQQYAQKMQNGQQGGLPQGPILQQGYRPSS